MNAVMPGSAATEPWLVLLEAASRPYRKAGRFAWGFARGKLARDPVFLHLVRHGLIAPHARVLDIGCGQGLLASLLQASQRLSQQGRWPHDWAAAPAATRVTGIELAPGEVERARASLGEDAEFICGDMRHTPFPLADAVVILDVLHYVTVPEQNDVLARARQALSPGGVLLLRVADAAARGRFAASRWVDAAVLLLRGRPLVRQFGRTLGDWIAQLESLGFEVRSQPMGQGTPFANVLLVARVAS